MKFELNDWFVNIEEDERGWYWTAYPGEEDFKIECIERHSTKEFCKSHFTNFSLKHNLDGVHYT